MKDLILKKIQTALPDSEVNVVDKSHLHQGHAGVKGRDGNTHFDVEVISSKFNGMNKVQKHKMIYEILSEEMKDTIHALSIKAHGKTPLL